MATALRALLVLLLSACSSTEHSSVAPQASSSFQALIDNAQATLHLGTPTLRSSQKGDFEEGVLHFYLDDRYPLANTRLKIEELWIKAEVWLDGNSLGETLGGSFPSHLQLPPDLQPGAHTLGFRVWGAEKKSGLLQGSRRDNNHRKPSIGHVSLQLLPESHIQWLTLPLEGDQVSAKAAVTKAPPGARVEFTAYLDGAAIQDLGEALVIDGVAQAPPTVWNHPLWSPQTGGDALFHFEAKLLSAKGEPIDALKQLNGVRSVEFKDNTLHLNQESLQLFAVRMEETWKKDGANLRELLGVGINALEIHGSYPPEEWLQMANESGLMVVVLPRCDGEVFARPEDVDAHIKSIKAQHADIAAHLLGHPSMLFWTTEGTPQLTRRLSRTFHSDPMHRLVTGKEIPAVSLSLQNQSLEQLRAGSWVTEITNLPGSRPETTLSLFERALDTGAIGGVLPVSRNQPEIHRIWTEGVKRLAAKMNLPTYTPKSHRSAMTLRIEGLQPGHIVWAEATGIAPIGAVASSSGEASLRLFHKGSVELTHNGTPHTVLLNESSRFGASSQQEAQRLQWP